MLVLWRLPRQMEIWLLGVWSCVSLPHPLHPLLPDLIMEISRRRSACNHASTALFVNITRCLLETFIVPATYGEVYRERMTPILFETFSVSAIHVVIQAVFFLCGSLHTPW